MANLSLQTLDGLVELFVLDTTAFPGGTINRVCNSRVNKNQLLSEATVTYSGYTYICLPFETANFKRGGDRAERPKIVLPDGSMDFFNALMALGGAPGAKVTRYQIMAADLLANSSVISTDAYVLDKATWDAGKITFELSAPHAFRKLKFPSKQMLRDEYPGLGAQLLR